MNIISLQSGSNGNCIYVEDGEFSVLFDAGISGIQAERRLANHGRNIRDVSAVIISHEHNDHIRSAGIYGRKYGLPLHVTQSTLSATRTDLGKLREVCHFNSGETFSFGNIGVFTVPTPHDGVDGCAFVVSGGGKRLGIFTDLGHPFAELQQLLPTLDGVIIESNYDEQMLDTGPYPWPLKQRIKGPRGHLSNLETAHLLKSAGSRLQWALLGHLSEQNNTPERALETNRSIVGPELPIHVASRYRESSVFSL